MLAVDVELEPGAATVRPRRRGSGESIGLRAERFRGDDAPEALVMALRGARLLRTLRSVDLRIVLETAQVLLQVAPVGAGDDWVVPAVGSLALSDDFTPPCRIPTGADDRVIEVRLERTLATELGQALCRRRCGGTVGVVLGPLLRCLRVVRRVGPERPEGLVIDVTRAAVTILEVRSGGISTARAVPAGDLRAALLGAAAPRVRALGRIAGRDGRLTAPWLHLAAPDELAAGVRRACARMLEPEQVVDVVRLRGGDV